MNATIEKIIGQLFEDIEETEETRAIRDEIQTNCQERYDDLIRSGLSEDDAIQAVAESLKGMEELLQPYPRKLRQTGENGEGEAPRWEVDPAEKAIREIRAEHLGSADVTVERSPDHRIHVRCDRDNVTLMTGIEDGVLTIGLREEKNSTHIDFSGDFSFDINDIGRLFEKLAQKFISATKEVRVYISIPQEWKSVLKIHTASGNVEIQNLSLGALAIGTASGEVRGRTLAADSLSIGTASGDVCLEGLNVQNKAEICTASGDQELDRLSADVLEMHSASGDITVNGCTIRSRASLKSASGDVEWMSDCPECKAVSISGDLKLSGGFETVAFSTVSGDVRLMAEDSGLQTLQGATTSGDIQAILPQGVTASVSCRTRNGDLHQHVPSDPASPVRVELNSVSGDITVR